MGYILWLNVATQMTENHCSIQGLGICKKSLEVYSQSCPTVLLHIAYHHNCSRWREVYASFLHFKSQKHWQDINFFWSFDSNVYLLLDLYLYYSNSSGYYGQPEKKITCFKSSVLYQYMHYSLNSKRSHKVWETSDRDEYYNWTGSVSGDCYRG